VTLLLVAVGIAIVVVVAVLVARDRPVLEDDPVDARRLDWPPDDPLTPAALADARFTVALRGYRMDEVDRVLDDARAALAARDERIADLEEVIAVMRTPAPAATDPGRIRGGAPTSEVPQ